MHLGFQCILRKTTSHFKIKIQALNQPLGERTQQIPSGLPTAEDWFLKAFDKYNLTSQDLLRVFIHKPVIVEI